ncbi:NPCBM/NEW2 domain-containing protein [Paludisphaera sp.]|uniref:NPCBM/NEW2 domain-containing protein n=1 Tax=Paludisphaera sp. TaxID=2017432 RepID=UPI00301C2209
MHAPRGLPRLAPLLRCLLAAGVSVGVVRAADYGRALDAKSLDQPTLDAEGFGDKKSLKREDDGLRVTLAQGAEETGWKTPQQLRFGGDFTVTAEVVLTGMPKPAIADGVAVGLAIGFQSTDQPDATFLRVVEPDGSAVYRALEKSAGGGMDPMQQQMMMMQQRVMMMNNMGVVVMGGGNPNAAKPGPPPRKTFPAAGDSFRLVLRREGQVVRFLVADDRSAEPRYLAQATLQPQDVMGVKLFAANRSGAGPVDVVFKSLTVRADRVTGLGTAVRTVFDRVVHGEPTAIEDGKLVVGGPPAAGGSPTPTMGAAPSSVPPEMAAAMAAARARVAPAGVVMAAPAGGAVVAAIRVAPAPAAGVVMQAPANVAPPPAQPAQPQGTATAGPGELPADVFAPATPAEPAKPKAVIPLDELEGIRFERDAAAFAARFVGQPNVDVTQGAPVPGKGDEPAKQAAPDDVAAPPPGTVAVKPPPKVEAKKNGIRDIQIALSGLRPAKIQQIQINCQTDQGQTSWQLEGAGGWPLVLRRSGTDPTADAFLEPPPADCHQKQFMVNVTYEDGQSAATNFQADGHSDAKLAFDENSPAAATPDAWVFLDGGDRLFGKLEGVADDVLKLATPWKQTLAVPLSRIAGVHVVLEDRKETPDSFDRRLKARGTEDLLLARAKNGEIVPISGILEGVDGGRLSFTYQGRSRSLPVGQVEGIVLADRPSASDDGVLATFLLLGDVAVTGRWKAIEGADWKLETPWGQEVKLPAAEIREVRLRGGKLTYLSDLEPSKVEEASFFGRLVPWRRDASLSGGKLKMDGRAHDRGIAVHSRCVLTYELGGGYDTFEALVGFDDEARGRGRVDFRVLADDEEIHAAPDMRGDAPPVPLKLKVAGASRLKIVVDFGAGQDVGDRVILADARLFRADATEPSR